MDSTPNYETAVTFEHLLTAMHKSSNGVRWKASVQSYEVNTLRWAANTMEQLNKNIYHCKGFNTFKIHERGKLRIIQAVHISDRAVQKMINEYYLRPVIVPTLVYDNAASLPGKGTQFALDRLKKHLQRHYRKHGRTGGILVMDFKNYFGSINHEMLIKQLKKFVKDEKMMKLIEQIINHCDGDTGIGLGSEIFQICAIFYPSIIDHYIKETLHIKGYGRYMDDSYLIHEDIDYLRKCLKEIRNQCSALGICVNDKRTRIYRLDESFPYLKKRIKLTETGKVVMRLQRENVMRERKRLRKQRKMLDCGEITFDMIKQSYQAWRSYAKKCDAQKIIYQMDSYFKELFGKERHG